MIERLIRLGFLPIMAFSQGGFIRSVLAQPAIERDRILWNAVLNDPKQDAEQEESESADRVLEPVSDAEFALPLPADMAADVDSAIERLNSPDSAERETATERLIEIGAPAMAKLRDAYRATDDLEVQLRIEHIVHNAYFDHHVYSQHAFLGVSLQPYAASEEHRVTLPLGVAGLMLANVIADTAAERAQLKPKDVLIGVDGQYLRTKGVQGRDEFSRSIASRQPGSRMNIVVLRQMLDAGGKIPIGEEELEFSIILGRCPRELAQRGSATAVSQALRIADERFYPWWEKHFGKSDD